MVPTTVFFSLPLNLVFLPELLPELSRHTLNFALARVDFILERRLMKADEWGQLVSLGDLRDDSSATGNYSTSIRNTIIAAVCGACRSFSLRSENAFVTFYYGG